MRTASRFARLALAGSLTVALAACGTNRPDEIFQQSPVEEGDAFSEVEGDRDPEAVEDGPDVELENDEDNLSDEVDPSDDQDEEH